MSMELNAVNQLPRQQELSLLGMGFIFIDFFIDFFY